MIRAALIILLGIILVDTTFASFMPKAFQANFLQEKRSAVSNRIVKSKLKIKYQYPSNFYLKEVADNTLYICNASKVYLYNPPMFEGEKGFLRIGSSNKYCYSKIFDALRKGLKDNKLYTVSKTKSGSYQLKFRIKARKQLGLNKMEIFFKASKNTFRSIKKLKLFYDGDRYPTILKTTNLKVVERFPKHTFKFNTPKNTEVKKMK